MQNNAPVIKHNQTTMVDFVARLLYAVLVCAGLYYTMPALAALLWLAHRFPKHFSTKRCGLVESIA